MKIYYCFFCHRSVHALYNLYTDFDFHFHDVLLINILFILITFLVPNINHFFLIYKFLL